MPALTEARYDALRCARAAARAVLAKHPCVTGGGSSRTGDSGGTPDRCLDCDRVLAAYERQEVGRGEGEAGAGGPR